MENEKTIFSFRFIREKILDVIHRDLCTHAYYTAQHMRRNFVFSFISLNFRCFFFSSFLSFLKKYDGFKVNSLLFYLYV